MIENANEMTYNGNLVFHYTSYESAQKIIESNTLKFGRFQNMNDIDEVRRDYICYNPQIMSELLSEYQSISLVDDSSGQRGFAIDCMWGYYADKGKGVCLVFNKSKLVNTYGEYINRPVDQSKLKIEYRDFEYGNNHGLERKTESDFIQSHLHDIFYTKNVCWKHEREMRLLTKSSKGCYLGLNDALIGVILCYPQKEKLSDIDYYLELKKLCDTRKIKLYRYTTALGNKELHCGDKLKWPIAHVDYELDLGNDEVLSYGDIKPILCRATQEITENPGLHFNERYLHHFFSREIQNVCPVVFNGSTNLHPEWATCRKGEYGEAKYSQKNGKYIPDDNGYPGFIDFAIGNLKNPSIAIEFKMSECLNTKGVAFDYLKLLDNKNNFNIAISYTVVYGLSKRSRAVTSERLNKVFGSVIESLSASRRFANLREYHFIVVAISGKGEYSIYEKNNWNNEFQSIKRNAFCSSD